MSERSRAESEALDRVLAAVPSAVLSADGPPSGPIRVSRGGCRLLQLDPPSGNRPLRQTELPAELRFETHGAALPLVSWLEQMLEASSASGHRGTVIRPDGSRLDVIVHVRASRGREAWAAFLFDISLERALGADSARRGRQQSAIASIGIAALALTDVDRLLQRACRLVRDGTAASYVGVYRRRADDVGFLEPACCSRARAFEALDVEHLDPAVVAGDDPEHPRPHPVFEPSLRPPALVSAGLGSTLVDALYVGPHLWGVLLVAQADDVLFTEDDASFVQAATALIRQSLIRQESEQQLLEQEIALERATLESAESLAALGTLAAGIVHEISNPLNSIQMNAELARMQLSRGEDPARLEASLSRIVEDCKRCAQISRGVLAFAREREDLPAEVVTVGDVVQQAFRLVQAGDTPPPRIRIGPASAGVSIKARRTELEQLFVNLLRNSAQAGATVNRIRARRHPADGVTVEVADDGPGLPEGTAETLFRPFVSGRAGTGLGLSICRRIAEAHGGTIRAENLRRGGCRFRVTLRDV